MSRNQDVEQSTKDKEFKNEKVSKIFLGKVIYKIFYICLNKTMGKRVADEFVDISDEKPLLERIKSFSFEKFLEANKLPVSIALIGLILTGFGVFLYKSGIMSKSDKIEVLEGSTEAPGKQPEIVVEIAGAVEKPGVYTFSNGSRINDLLISAGGLSSGADRAWVDQFINKAAKLIDGQKVFIKTVGEQSDTESANFDNSNKIYQAVQGSGTEDLTNINTASQKLLEKLPGIGPVYAQNIIEQRPYSNINELLDKGVLRPSTFEKIKDLITAY